ncbi:lantibiotic dehydratase [Nannocystis radixulma]|uniref:Lantibiotic dehydratase n=1 Tax=Nannocystis radixulma TaxID=2995305 RepID=A0ABT5B6I8_9BACT|nr:lantibiotic dehydratase [Nannocystis radixulma]MDC0669732.1 lantibiotic dehydratase [Nannocystis radixulma]
MPAREIALCPAAVVRVAAFPLSRVQALAEPELAAQAREASPKDMSAWTSYCEAYAAAVERTRATLWASTADDPAFMRALTLGNPELARSVAGTARAPRSKRVRHRETSLYRHLARAVARPEPNGMWAGVALARVGEGEGVTCEAAATRCAFAPDLGVFAAMFAALGARPDYRARARFKLNPTLRVDAEGVAFRLPHDAGLCRVPPAPALTRAIAALRAATATVSRDEAAAVLAAAGFPASARAGVVDLLVAQGVLVGGLRFPTRFTSPWDALEQAAGALSPVEAAPWRAAARDLQAQCDALSESALGMTPAALAEALASADARVAALAEALGLGDIERPRAALRCDTTAPFAIALGRDVAATITAAAAELSAFTAGLGMGGALGPALVDRWLGAAGRDLAGFEPPALLRDQVTLATWEGLGEELGPELAARATAWADRLTGTEAEELVTPELPSGGGDTPLGCLLFTIGRAPTVADAAVAGGPIERVDLSAAIATATFASEYALPGITADSDLHAAVTAALGTHAVIDRACERIDAGRLVLRGLVRDATPAFARCAGLLEPRGGAVTQWLCAQYERVTAVTGVDQAALGFAHACPNVQASPRFVPHLVDVWAADGETVDLRGARVERDVRTGAPVCIVPGRARPLAIHSFTAAQPPDDPCQYLLLVSSMRTPPQIPRGDRLGFRAELESRRHSPRVRLPGGAVVRTRRSVLVGDDLRALVGAAAGAARFAVWQRLARERGWPELVLVHRDGEPPLLVPRDAPLAVEAMSEGAGGVTCITVEEFIDDAWISTVCGERHVAELALSVVRPALLERLGAAVAAGQRLADCA